jgi:hypothetical protein
MPSDPGAPPRPGTADGRDGSGRYVCGTPSPCRPSSGLSVALYISASYYYPGQDALLAGIAKHGGGYIFLVD